MKVVSYDIGRKNLAWCLVKQDEFSQSAPEILQCKVVTLQGSNMQQWVQAMHAELCNSKHTDVDACLIEAQPALNPRMVALAQALHMWYLCNDVQVHFCSPKAKLQQLSDPVGIPLPKDKYKRRKALSVHHAMTMASADGKAMLTSHAKQDDVCDAYLMAVAWLERNAVIEL